ncbi:IS1595 family transposase [Clostridia bacterium OttesenSCG-928-O13]|nr:IS1595 family transposase [Clostridia bacterium OttesenSCG-928-O13]
MKNMYIYHAHISEEKTRRLIKCFALDLTSTQTAELTGLNLNTVDRIFNKIRDRILENSQGAFLEQDAHAVDVGRIGPGWAKGKHSHGVVGETIIFGLIEREGKVYTEIVPGAKAKMLQAIIRGQAGIEDAIHAPDWHDYDGLVDLGYEKLFRLHHSDDAPSSGHGHHGIERFWNYAKRRLAKFKGIPKAKFELHLKETEFRFNAKGQNIYLILLKELRNNPLNQGNPKQ